MLPWDFDVDVDQDIRHLWYRLMAVARLAELEVEQIHLDYKRNMQHRNR